MLGAKASCLLCWRVQKEPVLGDIRQTVFEEAGKDACARRIALAGSRSQEWLPDAAPKKLA